jgi:Flp pilus assembly protein TadD
VKARAGARYNEISIAARRATATTITPVLHLWRHCFLTVFALAAAAGVCAQDAREVEKLFRGGDAALAMQRADKAIAERPRDASMRFLRAVMLTELQRTTEAIDALNKLIEDFPDLPEPYNNLAVLLAAQGRIDTARDLLETALRHDPSYAVAHENLGDVFVRLALRAFERASSTRSDEGLQRKLRLTRELAAARTARP